MLDVFFVHPTDISVPLNLKVRTGLNSQSDIFIHIVPYGPTVGSFFFSLSVMESANLAKQILRKRISQCSTVLSSTDLADSLIILAQRSSNPTFNKIH